MEKFTKIVATISDKRCDKEFISQLVDAGLNVVRMNSAHLKREGFENIINNVRAASNSVAIMMDTKGPEVRTTTTINDLPVEFRADDKVVFAPAGDDTLTSHEIVYLNFSNFAAPLSAGNRILIDDGELEFEVLSVEGPRLIAVACNDGSLGSRKSVNFPGVSMPLPSLTQRDKNNIRIGAELGVDFIAHSFVRSADDVKAVQKVIDSCNADIKIISKIENQEGVDNFDEILAESYGIMIARGDLGIEVPAEKIPGIQIMMIEKCMAAHKPVIVATQMLHSMIEHPRPTRAEVSDVAAAVAQHADALMLSGETAYGKYPVEAVRFMSKIALEVENAGNFRHDPPPLRDKDITSFLARQAVVSEKCVGTSAIITDSYHGLAARYIASFRGTNPTFAICYNDAVMRWLALSYGVRTFLYKDSGRRKSKNSSDALAALINSHQMLSSDCVAYLSGSEAGVSSLEIGTLSNLVGE